MTHSIRTILLAAALLLAAVVGLAGENGKNDPNDPAARSVRIVVNGRTLTGPNSSAQIRGARVWLPATVVARALGDRLSIDQRERTATVERADGVVAVFEAASGQVVENASVILSSRSASEIAFPQNPEELLLPAETASAIFGASVRYDDAGSRVLVDRGRIADGFVTGTARSGFGEIHRAMIGYDMNRYSGSQSQNLQLQVAGRVGSGRFSFDSNLAGRGFRDLLPRRTQFALELPGGARFRAGDVETGSSLMFLGAGIRGGAVEFDLKRTAVVLFGGRSASGDVQPIEDPDGNVVFPRSAFGRRFDTSTFGGGVSRDFRVLGSAHSLTLSAGGMYFDGRARSGRFGTVSVAAGASRFRLEANVAAGTFRGRTSDGRAVNGFGSALDVAFTWQVLERLSLQGRYSNVGRNFLAAQTGSREPMETRAAGMSWSPANWLTASFNLSTTGRPGDNGRRESFLTGALALSPGDGTLRFFLSHTASRSRFFRDGAFTLVNGSKDFGRWRAFFAATRMKTLGPASANVTFGSEFRLDERQRLEAAQGIGTNRSLTGSLDWRLSGLFRDRVEIAAGVGYNASKSGGASIFERASFLVKLPRETSLQVNFNRAGSRSSLLVGLKIRLFKRREAASFLAAEPSEMNRIGVVTGRVFQDIDGDGKFSALADRAQAAVRVRIDGNRYVETDSNGFFRFDGVVAGNHRVYLDLTSVRADLTMLDGDAREFELLPGGSTAVDFRLVRTGVVRGRVWFDANGNGQPDENEAPMAEVRIVTASGRDTITDENGYFAITDLAPGVHVVLIDEKTLPENVVAVRGQVSVKVEPGGASDAGILLAANRPAEVKFFGVKAP